MSYPPDPAASPQRCTVAGIRRTDGSPMSLVCEQVGNNGSMVLYPHGIEGHGVMLDTAQQQALGRWLLNRETTIRPALLSDS